MVEVVEHGQVVVVVKLDIRANVAVASVDGAEVLV